MMTLLILLAVILLPAYATVRLVLADRSDHPPLSHPADVTPRTRWP